MPGWHLCTPDYTRKRNDPALHKRHYCKPRKAYREAHLSGTLQAWFLLKINVRMCNLCPP
jgi:hypothetical protein